MRTLDHGELGQVYNIGSAIGRSNKDVLDAIVPLAERGGFDINVSYQASRNFDVPVNVLSHYKLTAQTQWQPRVSFEDGLAEMWEDLLDTVARS
jgi:UDP-glucose 4-epimerase